MSQHKVYDNLAMVARLMLRVKSLEGQLAEGERLLREFEWAPFGSLGYCKICRNLRSEGHKDGCELGKFLEGGE